MTDRILTTLLAPVLALALGLTATATVAHHRDNHQPKNTGGGTDEETGGNTDGGTAVVGWYPWMSGDVADAWASGFDGKEVDVTVVDNFSGGGSSKFAGNLGDGRQRLLHGEWTLKQTGMVAPGANVMGFQYGATTTPTIGLSDIFNLSYGLIGDPRTETLEQALAEYANEGELIRFANEGLAVVVHAAGNSATAYGDTFTSLFGGTQVDFLAQGLIGAITDDNDGLNENFSGLFVGALDKNGSFNDRAALASYSNFAGTDPLVQSRFLVVGVRDDLTGLAGTSFAAPIISGYAAILSQKFGTSDPSQLTNHLLNTAISIDANGGRTLVDLGKIGEWDDADVAAYGQGEASLARALAPASIY